MIVRYKSTVRRRPYCTLPESTLPSGESWDAMLARIRCSGIIHPLTTDAFGYLLEMTRPPFIGGAFVIMVNGVVMLLWRTPCGRFCRQLTPEETTAFCMVWPNCT